MLCNVCNYLKFYCMVAMQYRNHINSCFICDNLDNYTVKEFIHLSHVALNLYDWVWFNLWSSPTIWPYFHVELNMHILTYFWFSHPAASHQTGKTGWAATGNRQPLRKHMTHVKNHTSNWWTHFISDTESAITSFFSTTSQATCSPSRPLKGISRVNISHRTWKKPTYNSQLCEKENYLCQQTQ